MDECVLVTHQGCLDGSGCVIFFILAGGKIENVRYVAAGMVERFIKKDPVFSSNKFLIFADVGLNLPKYADILEKRGNVVMFDHHKSSTHLVGRHWAVIDEKNERCGCVMLRDYLIDICEKGVGQGNILKSSSYRIFAETIDDHDRWQGKMKPHSDNLALIMPFYGQEEFVRRFTSFDPKERVCMNISRGVTRSFFDEIDRELLIILEKKRNDSAESLMKKIRIEKVETDSVGTVSVGWFVSADPNISFILNKVLDERPDIDVACSISFDRGAVSLRSRDGKPDVSLLAAEMGGGGHASAAGHRIPQAVIDTIAERIYE